jgi:outer membrane biogenesis lipoprotein LolB
MKFSAVVTQLRLLLFACTMLVACSASAQQGAYRIGDIVTNFALPNRYQWTNDNGQVFTPGSTLRLSDFAGKIVFCEVFAVW